MATASHVPGTESPNPSPTIREWARHRPDDLKSRAQAALERVDLPSLMSHLGIPLEWRGNRPWALCWVHADKNPSLALSPPEANRKGHWTYYCHGCKNNRGDAINVARTKQQLTFAEAVDYLEQFIGASPSNSTTRPVPAATWQEMPTVEQHRAAEAFIELLDAAVPQARSQAIAYLTGRGARREVIDQVGGAWLVTKDQWRSVSPQLRSHPLRDLLLRAGLARIDPWKHVSAAWFDDTCVGVSRDRDGRPLFFWGRSTNPQTAPERRYRNQSVSGGSHSLPYGLDALAAAAETHGTVRLVEGPITALGARSLGDGQAAPTIAVLRRLGWHTPPTAPDQLALWQSLLPDLRACRMVEICPDNDQAKMDASTGSPDAKASAKMAEGLLLAENLAHWMRQDGVNAVVRLLAPLAPPLSSWIPLPGVPYFMPFGYPEKDFADVARRQNQAAATNAELLPSTASTMHR